MGLIDSEGIVKWAVDAIVFGSDSKSLRVLAGLQPPLDQIEIKRLFTLALRELEIKEIPSELHATFYIQSILEKMLREKISRKDVLKCISNLCIDRNYDSEFWDFYLLYNAISDLESEPVQRYWNGADRSNIDMIVDEYARKWLHSHAH